MQQVIPDEREHYKTLGNLIRSRGALPALPPEQAHVPLMVVIILLVSKKSVMGTFTASRSIIILGWIATAVMGLAAVRMFIPG